RLTDAAQSGRELARSGKDARSVEHAAMHVREEQSATRRSDAGDATQRAVDGFRAEVVRHTFPNEEGTIRLAESGGPQRLDQVVVLEVHLDEDDVTGQPSEELPEAPLLRRKRGGMVNLEDARTVDAGQAVGT